MPQDVIHRKAVLGREQEQVRDRDKCGVLPKGESPGHGASVRVLDVLCVWG